MPWSGLEHKPANKLNREQFALSDQYDRKLLENNLHYLTRMTGHYLGLTSPRGQSFPTGETLWVSASLGLAA